MAKIEKRSNPPQNMTVLSTFSPQGEKCGVCRKENATRRYYNSWRMIDVCQNQPCMVQGSKWACNSPHTKRVDVPISTFRKPGEFKYLTRKADAVAKPPGRSARAR